MPDIPAVPAAPVTSAAARLDSIDLLRGLVMVVMALDHTRDYFHADSLAGVDPLDLGHTTTPLFLTRWITHFCAPIFSFLAGTGVYLSLSRGKTKREMSWFLLTRGAWLIILELTYVKWAWTFAYDPHVYFGIVIWALGWSMVALAALIHLPWRAVAGIGLAIVALHNALDAVPPDAFGPLANLWRVLHIRGMIHFTDSIALRSGYPLLPWIGVMATGYAFGAVYQWEPTRRQRWLVRTGLACVALFILLRATNLYGNLWPRPPQPTVLRTVLATLDATKYPPSLCYVLMTIGPALLLLVWFERRTPTSLRPALVFGRVPFFYYMLHIPVIHALASACFHWQYGRADFLGFVAEAPAPAGAGFSLAATYGIWLAIVAAVYPLCRWFADYKRRHRDVAWLSYF